MGGNGIRTSDPVSGPVAHGPASSSRLPVVLSVAEVQALLGQLRGVHYLICALLYGTGMRLLECLSLRVRDLDFDRHAIRIRAAKGQKDRTVALPERLAPQLRDHLAGVHALRQEDLATAVKVVGTSTYADFVKVRSLLAGGFSQVGPAGSQLRVGPLQRPGLLAFACS